MLRLNVVRGADAGTTLEASGRRPRLLGRASRRLRLTDHKVSRQQATVWFEAGRWQITDLNSRHGTFVNGRRLSEAATLSVGDEIRMGNSVLKVVEATPPPLPVTPALPADEPEVVVPTPNLPDGSCLALYVERRRDGKSCPQAGKVLVTQSAGEIGREEAALALDDSRISRLHARVEPVGGDWIITDLGSSHGTFVNGWRLDRPTIIRENDCLWVGRLRLRVLAARVEEPAPPLEAQAQRLPAEPDLLALDDSDLDQDTAEPVAAGSTGLDAEDQQAALPAAVAAAEQSANPVEDEFAAPRTPEPEPESALEPESKPEPELVMEPELALEEESTPEPEPELAVELDSEVEPVLPAERSPEPVLHVEPAPARELECEPAPAPAVTRPELPRKLQPPRDPLVDNMDLIFSHVRRPVAGNGKAHRVVIRKGALSRFLPARLTRYF